MPITPPNNVWGLSVSPLEGAAPTELDSVAVRLREGQLARVRFLRWELRDFELPDSGLNPDGTGWMLTLIFEVASSTVHLWQGDGVFYTPQGQRLRYIDAPEHGEPSDPRWHKKSGNLWPVMNSTRLPFRGQFRTAEYFGYLFGDVENSTLAVSLHQVGEQDVEDHYASEE